MYKIKELLENNKLDSMPVLKFKSETVKYDENCYSVFLQQKNLKYLKNYSNFLLMQVNVDQNSVSNYLNLIQSVFVNFVESDGFLNLMSYKDPDMVDKLLVELENKVLHTELLANNPEILKGMTPVDEDGLNIIYDVSQESIEYFKIIQHGILNEEYCRSLFKSKVSQIFNYLRTLKLSSYYKNSYIVKNFIPIVRELMSSMDNDDTNVQRFNYNPNRLDVTDTNHLRVITRSYKDYLETGAKPASFKYENKDDVDHSFNIFPSRPLQKTPVTFEKFKLIKRNDTAESMSIFVKYSYLSNTRVSDELKLFLSSVLDKARESENEIAIQNPFTGQQVFLNQTVGLYFDIDKECFYFLSKKQTKIMNKKITLESFDGYNLSRIVKAYKSKIKNIKRKLEFKVYESDNYFELKQQIYFYERKLKSVVNSVFNQISTLLSVFIQVKFSDSELFLKKDCHNLLKMRGYSLDLQKVSQGHVNFNNKLHRFVRKVFSHFTKHYSKLKKLSKIYESEYLASHLGLNMFTMYKNPPKNYTWDRRLNRFVYLKENYADLKNEVEVSSINYSGVKSPKLNGLPSKLNLVHV